MNEINFYRFKEDLVHITSDLIYSGCVIFAVGGASEAYRDFMEEFFKCCSIIGRVYLEVINNNYVDYLINECDQIFVFWNDDENWDDLQEKLEQAGKEIDMYAMDSVTDEYRSLERYLQQVADDDMKARTSKRDIDYLLRYNVNHDIKKGKK